MDKGAKTKDKFIVSFNSDTSDSEDSSEEEEVKKVPIKSVGTKEKPTTVQPLVNGHVNLQNGEVSNSFDVSGRNKLSAENSITKRDGLDTKKDKKLMGDRLDESTSKLDYGSRETSIKESKGDSLKIAGVSTRKNVKGSLITEAPTDLLTSSTSGGSDHSLSGHGKSNISANDLDLAFARAKNKDTALARKSAPQKDNPELLIDLSDTSDHLNKKQESGFSTTSPKRRVHTGNLNKFGAMSGIDGDLDKELEAEMAEFDKKATSSNNFQSTNITEHIDDNDNDSAHLLGADILIYASPGTNPTVINDKFGYEKESEIGPKKSSMYDTKTFEDKQFYRQSSKPEEEQESVASPKYRNLDEKFSAICSKYGRDAKPDKGKVALDNNLKYEIDDDSYGAVKVKTGVKDDHTDHQNFKQDDEDQGFSETPVQKTPRQKLTFDDIVSWKKGSTDDLIQRILADARSEPLPATKHKDNSDSITNRIHETKPTNPYIKLDPYDSEIGADRQPYGGQDYHQTQPSLLERRLASMTGRDKKQDAPEDNMLMPYGRQRISYSEEPEPLYKRKARHASNEYESRDDYSDSGSTRYVPWKQRQKAMYDDEDDYPLGASASNFQRNSLHPPSRYDDSESDDDSYKSTRRHKPTIPDEYFKPSRSEDTDAVVKERTTEARFMVDHQHEVLDRLKKASKDFDDLDAEIKALKQQCIESQAARQAAIEDIIHDIKEDSAIDDEPAPYPKHYTRGSYHYDRYTPKYTSSYSSPYSSYKYGKSRDEDQSYFNKDSSSDNLGGYALGSVAKSRWGEPGGSRAFRSASVSRFDNVEEERFDKYGLYKPKSKRVTKPADDDARSDYSADVDESESASVRSFPSEKGGEEGEEDSSNYRSRYSSSRYRSQVTPSRYEPSYNRYSSSISSSSTREPRSTVRHSSTFSSGDSSFDRPRSRGTSLPPPDRPFTSRFLSKVREKKASGEDTRTRDKPFKSRFLTRSFDSDYHSGSSSRGSLASTPDKNSYSSSSPRSYSSRTKEDSTTSTNETTAEPSS